MSVCLFVGQAKTVADLPTFLSLLLVFPQLSFLMQCTVCAEYHLYDVHCKKCTVRSIVLVTNETEILAAAADVTKQVDLLLLIIFFFSTSH